PCTDHSGTDHSGTDDPGTHDAAAVADACDRLHRHVHREPVEHRVHREHHGEVERGPQRVDADLDVHLGSGGDAGVELGHHTDGVVRLGEERGVERVDP